MTSRAMTRLVHHLMKMRVRPYFSISATPSQARLISGHQSKKGIEIIRGMRGFTTGYAIPTFVVDALPAVAVRFR